MSDNLRTRIVRALRTDKVGRSLHTYELQLMADAVIQALGWREESCVQYTYAPRFDKRGLDACHDCGEPVIHDQESAAALIEKLNSRRHGFKPELVTRYVTDWVSSDE